MAKFEAEKEGKEKRVFPENIVSVTDIIADPYVLVKKLKNMKIQCKTCKFIIIIKLNEHYVKFLCGCGCRIIYPANENGVHNSVWISKEKFKKDFKNAGSK